MRHNDPTILPRAAPAERQAEPCPHDREAQLDELHLWASTLSAEALARLVGGARLLALGELRPRRDVDDEVRRRPWSLSRTGAPELEDLRPVIAQLIAGRTARGAR